MNRGQYFFNAPLVRGECAPDLLVSDDRLTKGEIRPLRLIETEWRDFVVWQDVHGEKRETVVPFVGSVLRAPNVSVDAPWGPQIELRQSVD